MTRTVLVALTMIAAVSPRAYADGEAKRFGDPSLRTAIESRTRAIYDAANGPAAKRVFLLVPDNPLSRAGAHGTEVTGVAAGGDFIRIVASVWTERGKYSIEYYLGEGSLLHVYETFTYFERAAAPGAWRNFMGLPAWERRVYFRGDAIGYAEATGAGAPDPGSGGPALRVQAQRLIKRLQAPRGDGGG